MPHDLYAPAVPDEVVLTERRGHVLVVTINRPEARNAVNLAVSQGVADALDSLDADPALRVGVLTGAGKGFSAGMDLKAFAAGERPHVGDRGFAGITRRSAEKPLIAAIEGFAVAGGLEVALSCDLIVAARDARLGIAEVKRGLIAAGGALFRLPQRIPYHAAMELALTGEFIDGERAHALGLVNRVAESGKALETALALAEQIAQNAPLALTASKKIVSQASGFDEAEAWRVNDEVAAPVFTSEDAREGALAFAEKRAPEWKGR
jgi:enoyl-CoA hydratase/carnithine racemase